MMLTRSLLRRLAGLWLMLTRSLLRRSHLAGLWRPRGASARSSELGAGVHVRVERPMTCSMSSNSVFSKRPKCLALVCLLACLLVCLFACLLVCLLACSLHHRPCMPLRYGVAILFCHFAAIWFRSAARSSGVAPWQLGPALLSTRSCSKSGRR